MAVWGTSDRTADSAARWAYGHHVRTSRVGTWAEAHRRWIALGLLLIVALVFVLWNHPTALPILLLVVILLVLFALLALLAASGRAAAVDADRVTPQRPENDE
ncbi:hypothetical protein [Streptomyces sp. E5N91]|uniref:hypothetical protein n=1 Tax=Streptomyces sp. E5N91 TaxID=1851996 RepID=UPI001EE8AA30|nr:hypothetical protein [Streptomyces sp. E5N91]